MNTRTMMEIDGRIDYRDVEQADHPITADERDYAIEVGFAIAERHGLDLQRYIDENAAWLKQIEQED